MNPDYLQMIPLLSLAVYFLYYFYYYAAPMFYLKILLFLAHIRYRDIDISFRDGKITVRYHADGEERILERIPNTEPPMRYFAMNVCSEFRGMLRDMRKGSFAEEGKENKTLEAYEDSIDKPDSFPGDADH